MGCPWRWCQACLGLPCTDTALGLGCRASPFPRCPHLPRCALGRLQDPLWVAGLRGRSDGPRTREQCLDPCFLVSVQHFRSPPVSLSPGSSCRVLSYWEHSGRWHGASSCTDTSRKTAHPTARTLDSPHSALPPAELRLPVPRSFPTSSASLQPHGPGASLTVSRGLSLAAACRGQPSPGEGRSRFRRGLGPSSGRASGTGTPPTTWPHVPKSQDWVLTRKLPVSLCWESRKDLCS